MACCLDKDVIRLEFEYYNVLYQFALSMHLRMANKVHYTLTKPDDPWKHCKHYNNKKCFQNEPQRKADIFTLDSLSMHLCLNIIHIISAYVCVRVIRYEAWLNTHICLIHTLLYIRMCENMNVSITCLTVERQRDGAAELWGSRGLHPSPLRVQTGKPQLSEEHGGPLGAAWPRLQVEGQEVGPALCCSVSLIVPRGQVFPSHWTKLNWFDWIFTQSRSEFANLIKEVPEMSLQLTLASVHTRLLSLVFSVNLKL